MEKFIDHTDIGMNQPSTCNSAKPTAMPASASTSGNPAAMSMPKATNSRINVGKAAHELGLVQRLRVDLVEVAPHGPFARHLGACARRELQLPT